MNEQMLNVQPLANQHDWHPNLQQSLWLVEKLIDNQNRQAPIRTVLFNNFYYLSYTTPTSARLVHSLDCSEEWDNGQDVKRCGLCDTRVSLVLLYSNSIAWICSFSSFSNNKDGWQDGGSRNQHTETTINPNTKVSKVHSHWKTPSHTFTDAHKLPAVISLEAIL